MRAAIAQRIKRGPQLGAFLTWWRGQDLNLRPSGYESDIVRPHGFTGSSTVVWNQHSTRYFAVLTAPDLRQLADTIRPRLWDFCGMIPCLRVIFWKFILPMLRLGFPRMDGQGETLAQSMAPFLDLYSAGLVGPQPCERRAARASAIAQVVEILLQIYRVGISWHNEDVRIFQQ